MAYTATYSSRIATQLKDEQFRISVTIEVSDGANTVYTDSESVVFTQNVSDLDTVIARLENKLKVKWDKWKAEQDFMALAAFTNKTDQILSDMNTYINS